MAGSSTSTTCRRVGNRNPRTYQFQWDGRRYVVRGRPAEVSDFTVHPYEGRDLIVQARTQRPLRPYFYALARKLADGVYLLTPIDSNDADEATRNRFCIKTRGRALPDRDAGAIVRVRARDRRQGIRAGQARRAGADRETLSRRHAPKFKRR